jgi:hypothetical protein
MTKTVGHWAKLRSHGCFAYLEHELVEAPQTCRALVERVIEGLGLATNEVQISTKDYRLQWSKFAWGKVDAALAKPSLAITLLVGTPSEVHLGAKIGVRLDPNLRRDSNAPPLVWLAAEAERWPAERFVAVARAWLRTLAETTRPLSGGVLAASDLRNAKIEASLEYESMHGEAPDAFAEAIGQEPIASRAWEKLRRIYPITLLGPMFAAKTNEGQLRDAGALAVERVGESLLVDAAADLVEVWSPAYLTATKRLRELVWPWSFQHPLDDPKRKVRG